MWSEGAVDTGDRCRGKDGFKIAAKRELAAAPTPGGTGQGSGRGSGQQTCLHTHTHTHMAGESFTTSTLSYMAHLYHINVRVLMHVCYISLRPVLTVFF